MRSAVQEHADPMHSTATAVLGWVVHMYLPTWAPIMWTADALNGWS